MKDIIPKQRKTDWYYVLLGLVIFALVSANELGFGIIAFVPLVLLAYWLMTKVFAEDTSSD